MNTSETTGKQLVTIRSWAQDKLDRHNQLWQEIHDLEIALSGIRHHLSMSKVIYAMEREMEELKYRLRGEKSVCPTEVLQAILDKRVDIDLPIQIDEE